MGENMKKKFEISKAKPAITVVGMVGLIFTIAGPFIGIPADFQNRIDDYGWILSYREWILTIIVLIVVSVYLWDN